MNIKEPHVDELKHTAGLCSFAAESMSHTGVMIAFTSLSGRPLPPAVSLVPSLSFLLCVIQPKASLSFSFIRCLCVCVCSTACETNIILHSVRSRDSSAGALLSSGRAFRIAAAPSGETDELWIIVVNKRQGGGGEREERWRKAHWVSAAEGPYLFIHPSIYLTL